jgi:hypothetical protein
MTEEANKNAGIEDILADVPLETVFVASEAITSRPEAPHAGKTGYRLPYSGKPR